MRRVEAAVEADEERRARVGQRCRAGVDLAHVEVDRLLAEDRLAARAARSISAACVRGGVQIITTCTAGSASAASRSAVARAP
jgi:hypothetical protein